MNRTRISEPLFARLRVMLRRTALTAVIATAAAGAASAQHAIGLKLGMNGNGDQQNTAVGALQPTDLAGAPGYEQANWNILGRWGNNSPNAFGTNAYPILDSAGEDTHLTIQWDATGNWSVQNSGTVTDQGSPDKNLMNAYADSNNGGNVPLTNSLANGVFGQAGANKPLVYLSGLQAWLASEGASSYDLVIYVDGDNQGGRTGEYWVQNAAGPTSNLIFAAASPTPGVDLTTHVFIKDYNNFTANPTYQEVPLTGGMPAGANNGRSARAGNYAVFPGLTVDSLLLRTAEFNTRCGINALQIIPRTTTRGPLLVPLPAAQTVPGGKAVFRAVAAGVVPVTYQWQRAGVNLVDGGNISGATNATLTIANVSAADVATYSVIVSNANGVATAAAPLALVTVKAGSYTEKVVTNGAVAYWRFNEQGDPSTNNSPAYDYVGGFTGFYGNSAQNGYNGVAGPLTAEFPGFEADNSALHTVGGNTTPLPYPSSHVNWVVAPALNLNTNTVTLCAWIKPAAVVQRGFCGLIFERGGSDTSGLGYGNNNNLGYTWNGGSASYNFVSGLVPPSNQWSFVALTVSPTNAVLYLYNVNGQFAATNTITHTNALFANPTYIGDDPSSTSTPQDRAFTGEIDEVAVFNRTLSDVELYTLYKKGLNVGIIPAGIFAQPRPVALMAGRNAQFSVTGSGDKPISYQWRANGVNLANGGRISGVTTPTLTISNVTAADAANYDVVLNNIANIPVSSTPVSLTVVASNSTPSAYEGALRTANPVAYWRLDEAAGTQYAYDYWGGNVATNENVGAGVPGPIPPDFVGLEPSNAAYNYDGLSADTDTQLIGFNNNQSQFTVMGWFNSGGTQATRTGLFGQNDVNEYGFHGADASGQAQLGIWTPAGGAYLSQTNIMPGQWYFTAAVGTSNSLTLYLFTTNGGGGFQAWQSSTPVNTTNYGSSAYAFKIGGGGILDATGNYFYGQIDEVAVFRRALSAGELSGLFASAQGITTLAPQITVQPVSQTLYAGRPAQLSVAAVGSATLNYQWRLNGVPLSDAGNLSGAVTPTLSMTNLAAANSGSYDVVITNTAGAVTSSVVTLTVLTPDPNGYEAAVIALQPLAYYRLNETNGTTAYDFFGGHPGVYQSAAVMGVPGPEQPAFFGFEANNAAVQVAANTASSWVSAPFGSLSTNTVTMAMWIKPTGTFDAYAGLLVNRNSGVAGGFGYTGGNIGYTWNNNNANTYNFRSGFVPPLDQWSFVALVVTPTNAIIYYGNPPNAMLTATNTVAHSADVFGNNWEIGSDDSSNNNNGSRTFTGSIDEVAVFTSSLSPDQMQRLYSVGMNGAPVSLSLQQTGGKIVLTWPRGTLLEAADLSGPWTPNAAARSPYTNSPAGGQKFYRVQVAP